MSASNMTTITSLPFLASSLPVALPTPPFSLNSPSVFYRHTSQTLQVLVAHYQRERMWVKQTLDVIALARHQHLHGSPRIITSNPKTGNRPPLWQRRCQHGLRLSNLSHAKLSKRLLMHNACGTRVLDSFAALLDARIESCRRIELLLCQSTQEYSPLII